MIEPRGIVCSVTFSHIELKESMIAEVWVYYPKKWWAACSKCRGSTALPFFPSMWWQHSQQSLPRGWTLRNRVKCPTDMLLPLNHTDLKEGQMNTIYLKITACPSGKRLLLRGRPEPCLDRWACAGRPESADRFSAHPGGTGNLRQSSCHLLGSWTTLWIGLEDLNLNIKN